MNWELAFDNLAAYSLHIFALGFAAGLALVFRTIPARVRLVWAQAVLVAAVLVPLAGPWRVPERVILPPRPVATVALPAVPLDTQANPLPWKETLLAMAAAGAFLRLAWLGLGCLRLSRYARNSEPYPDAVELDRVMRSAGVMADVGISPEVKSPVTFGFLAPVVLVPPAFAVLAPEARTAILLHELTHIRRRDWSHVLAEEVVRALFWFHPAVWWLLGQIHLCREQVVDAEVVARTGRRAEYVDTLLAVARGGLEPDLAPAPLFLKGRHLASRVDWLVQEATMPIRKTFATLAGVALAAIITGWVAVQAVPLQAPQWQEASSPGVRTDPGSLKLLHAAAPRYPAAALEKGIEGDVVLDLTVDAQGNVSDARVVSGPEELRKAALQSVLQWHYEAGAGTPGSTRATVSFKPEAGMVDTQKRLNIGNKMARRQPIPPTASRTVQSIDLAVPASLRDSVQSRLRIQKGDQLTAEALSDLETGLKGLDEHLNLAVRQVADGVGIVIALAAPPQTIVAGGVGGGVAGGVHGGVIGGVVGSGVGHGPITGIVSQGGPQQIRVGGNLQQKKLTHKVAPSYPPLAKQARIQGTVRLTAVIAADGTVRTLEVQNGHPLLVPAAVEAVRQWQYEATLLNGNPVEVVTQIDINFTLAGEPPPEPLPAQQ